MGYRWLVLHELLYSSRYWNISATVDDYRPVQTAEESRQLSRQILPINVIADFKARSVNSNWDTCYCGFCLYLITLLSRLPDISSLLPLRPEQGDWIAAFRRQLATLPPELQSRRIPATFHIFSQAPFQGATGLELINRFNDYASMLLGHPFKNAFARYGPSWLFCQDLFQEWYLGTELYAQTYNHPPAQPGKPGCIHFEQPLLPLEKMRPALEQLRDRAGRDGQPVTDGVFPETKEFLAKELHLLDVDSPARAYALAAEVSAAPGLDGKPLNMGIEVRQVLSAPPLDMPAAAYRR